MVNIVIFKKYVTFVLPYILRHIADSLLLHHILECFKRSVLVLVHIDDAALDYPAEYPQQAFGLLEIGSASQIVHVLNDVSLAQFV